MKTGAHVEQIQIALVLLAVLALAKGGIASDLTVDHGDIDGRIGVLGQPLVNERDRHGLSLIPGARPAGVAFLEHPGDALGVSLQVNFSYLNLHDVCFSSVASFGVRLGFSAVLRAV